jgi:hypothetical protein
MCSKTSAYLGHISLEGCSGTRLHLCKCHIAKYTPEFRHKIERDVTSHISRGTAEIHRGAQSS